LCKSLAIFSGLHGKPLKRFPELKNTSHHRLKPGENEKLIFFTASAVRGIFDTASAVGGWSYI